MKKSDIYEIAIKIFGLYLFWNSINILGNMISSQYYIGVSDRIGLVITSIGVFVLVSLFVFFLLFKTKAIIKIVCNKSNFNEPTQLFIDKKIIYEIALKFTGLLIVVWTLPMFALKLIGYILFLKLNVPSNDSDTDFLIVASIKIFVGFIAIVFSNPISRFLSKESKDNQSK